MKHFNWLFIGFLALVSCENNQRELNELKKQVDSLTRAVSEKDSMIAQLNGTIVKLQYPADQRIAKAKSLVDEGKFEQALGEIRSLKELFPNSTEANSSSILIETINKKREEARKEEERIKALGFKAIKESSNFKIGYNTIAIGSISIGNRFTFDSYDDSWFYKDADRGAKFVSLNVAPLVYAVLTLYIILLCITRSPTLYDLFAAQRLSLNLLPIPVTTVNKSLYVTVLTIPPHLKSIYYILYFCTCHRCTTVPSQISITKRTTTCKVTIYCVQIPTMC